MSLAYTTLLSVVPLLVFSFSILKGLGARGDLRFILEQFFAPLGGASEQLTGNVMQFVRNMRGDLLGAIGLAFLVYTVVTTIQKVESSFNYVWRVQRPRSFARRFTEYLSVMILGPVLLAVALGLLGSAERSPFALWIDAIGPLAWMLRNGGQLVPYVIVSTVFTFMYIFIPNTKVQLRAALIGGISSGAVWAVVGQIFTSFIVYSSSLVAVYTGFAIVLTTLIWVYLSWLILLLGAQLAFYLQFPQYLRHGQEAIELTGRDREQVGLSAMYLIARDYAAGKTNWTIGRLAAGTGYSEHCDRRRSWHVFGARWIGHRHRAGAVRAGQRFGQRFGLPRFWLRFVRAACGPPGRDHAFGGAGGRHSRRGGSSGARDLAATLAERPDLPLGIPGDGHFLESSTEPTRTPPRASMSSPTAAMPLNIAPKLPAMVISATGYCSWPFSTQKPAAPRE